MKTKISFSIMLFLVLCYDVSNWENLNFWILLLTGGLILALIVCFAEEIDNKDRP